jgi:Tfp pilus assembly protein PilF
LTRLAIALVLSASFCSGQDAERLYTQSGQLRAAGKLADAVGAMDKAIAIDPGKAEYFRARASLKLALKDYAGVEADAIKGVALEPRNARLLNLLGSSKQQRRDYAGALPYYQEAIAADPAFQAPLLNKGICLSMLDRLDEAEALFKAVVAAKPDTGLAYNRLGFIKEKRKDWTAAIEYFSRAIALDPKDYQSLNSRGVCRVELKDYAGAKADFDAALRWEPGFATAQNNLQKLSARETRTVQAPVRAPGPAMVLPPVRVPAPIEFADLPGSVYESAVSAAMEGMKLVLAPATEAENQRVEALWAPAFRFPCGEVVDYLNRLNPLLARFLSYRTAASYAQAEYSRLFTEAAESAAWEADDAVQSSMAEAEAQARQLKQLRGELAKTADAIRALGDPPNPEELMGKARKRAQQAFNYLKPEQDADLEYIQRSNFVRVMVNGSLALATRAGQTRQVDVPAGGIVHGLPLQWNQDEFFYAGPPMTFTRKTGATYAAQSGTYALWGKVSPDGGRLLALRLTNSRPDGTEFAVELKEVDLRNRQQSFDATTLFLNNFSMNSNNAKGDQMARATARFLLLGGKWDDGQVANVTEYKPFAISVSLFQDPDAGREFRSPEPLAGVRARLQTAWAKPNGWARISALSEDKLAALFPSRSSAAPVKPPAAAVSPAPAAKSDEEDTKARVAALRKDIEYIEADLKHLRGLKNADPKYLQFLLDAKQSEIQSKRDLIASYETGRYVHTRTVFDDRNRARLISECEKEVQQMAQFDRERRITETLRPKLSVEEQKQANDRVAALLASPAKLKPEGWREINKDLYSKYQAALEKDKAAADQDTKTWENRVWYAEWTKTVADTSFSLLAGGGGYKTAELIYLFGTSGIDGGLDKYYQTGSAKDGLKRGLFEGTKAVVTKLSDTVDYAWTAVDAYQQGGAGTASARLMNAASAVTVKYGQAKIMGAVTEKASQYLAQVKSSGKNGKLAIEAMKYKQQQEWDEALVKDFIRTDRQLRQATVTRGPAAELARLRQELERKAFSINSSYGAKVYLKHKTLPVDQRGYIQIMQNVHDELRPQLTQTLRTGGWSGNIRTEPIRNASSSGAAGIDYDLAIVERGDLNLARDGVPATAHQLREDAQKAWDKLYRQRTGYSAKVSLENITISTHPEAYADRAWLTVKDSKFMTPPDPAWAQQAADVTRFKAFEMQRDSKLLLGHFQAKQEACRGTAKDINTKVQTVLAQVEKQQGGKWTPEQRQKHNDVRTFWTDVQKVMQSFGQGDMDPLEMERRINVLSGGRGLDDLIDRAATTMEGYTKAMVQKK